MVLRIPPLDAFSNTLVVEPWCVVERKRGNQAVSIRVLVAEDAPVMRTALAALISADPALELVGMAEDAVEAIELARATRPDVAVVDVKMPGGGGSRATREILWHSPETRVLALSARCGGDARGGSRLLHAQGDSRRPDPPDDPGLRSRRTLGARWRRPGPGHRWKDPVALGLLLIESRSGP